MSKTSFFTALTLCTLLFAACQQTPAPLPAAVQETPKPDLAKLKAEIQAIENDWAKASNAKDMATVVAFYADDAISMTNNKPMITGKAAIKAEIEAEFAKRKDASAVVNFETLDVYGDEKVVTEVGKTTVKDATGKVTYAGKYMAVWEKRNGKWLTIRDISNDDAKEK
ncbi:MAG: nuclear transport factor 2 family protein [Saprospiraceae bacterium]|nr:nuclear transport factor 2 family protein [Saprospiraceae bacterium]